MRRYIFILTTILFSVGQLAGQGGPTVAFYNVENLFDTINDPAKNDGDFTPEGRYRWGTEKYNTKIDNISRVISLLGADIIGLAEVENAGVLDDLINTPVLRNYDYLHFDSRDSRGIGVAILYNVNNVEIAAYDQLRYGGGAPYTSRDILYACCKTEGETVHILVCHLPSVISGRKYRKIAAKAIRRYTDKITDTDPEAKIIVMGDFNADPESRVMSLITKDKKSVSALYNPFAGLARKGYGSYMYRGRWHMYDAIIVNDKMLGDTGLRYPDGGAHIFIRDFLMQGEGRYKGHPLRAISGDTFTGGFSDHLPVYVNLAF